MPMRCLLWLLFLVAIHARAAGPATSTFTRSPTFTPSYTATPSFTALPTPNGLHVSPWCTIHHVAGTQGVPGYTGDGGSAATARLNRPKFVAFDSAGNLYFSDSENHMIRRISSGGIITRYAGLDTAGVPTYGYNGDGIPATSAALYDPGGIVFDEADNLYIADTLNSRVRRVDRASGLISTYLGDGTAAYSGEGAAYGSPIGYPMALARDAFGALYFLENTVRVRKASGGQVFTFAGSTVQGYSGDGGPALGAQMAANSMAFDPAWNLFIADTSNQRIRRVDGAGNIDTVFGTGVAGSSGVGGPGTFTQLSRPTGVGFDPYGDLYVADMFNNRVLKMDGSGNSVLLAGGGATLGDEGPANESDTAVGYNFACDAAGNLYYATAPCHTIRKIDACGAAPSPTPSPTLTRSPSPSPTRSASPSGTFSPSASATRSQTPTASGTPSATGGPSQSPSPTPTWTHSATSTPTSPSSGTPSESPTQVPSASATSTPSAGFTASVTESRTATPIAPASFTPSSSASVSPTTSPSASCSPTGTPVLTATSSGSPTTLVTPSPSPSLTATSNPSATWTFSPAASLTDTPTLGAPSSSTDTPSPSSTPSASPSVSATRTLSVTPSSSPSQSPTPSPSPLFSATPSATASASSSPAPQGEGQLLSVQAVPNPAVGLIRLRLRCDGSVRVRLGLYSAAMSLILWKQLELPAAGWHSVSLDAGELPQGVYFVSAGRKKARLYLLR